MQEIEKLLLPIEPNDHPDCHVMYWMNSEISAIKEYAKKCINPLLEELETLRAENAKLIAELEALNSLTAQMRTHIADLTNEVNEYKAEREAMMKQEPVGYKIYDAKNKSEWITTIQNPEKYKRDYPDFILTPIYASPLPAQQIPEGYALDAKRYQWIRDNIDEALTPDSLKGEFAIEHKTIYVLPRLIAWASFCGQISFDEAVDNAMLSASQPKGESIERPANCRNRLHDEGKAYPRSGCYHCKTGGLTGCPFDKPKGE